MCIHRPKPRLHVAGAFRCAPSFAAGKEPKTLLRAVLATRGREPGVQGQRGRHVDGVGAKGCGSRVGPASTPQTMYAWYESKHVYSELAWDLCGRCVSNAVGRALMARSISNERRIPSRAGPDWCQRQRSVDCEAVGAVRLVRQRRGH